MQFIYKYIYSKIYDNPVSKSKYLYMFYKKDN